MTKTYGQNLYLMDRRVENPKNIGIKRNFMVQDRVFVLKIR